MTIKYKMGRALLSRMLLFMLCVLCVASNQESFAKDKVLFMFLDGFRWDYVSSCGKNDKLPGFNKIKNYGASVERIKPVFPTDCFPNIYSIFTGHYPSKHGVIFNDLYNVQNGDQFSHDEHSTRHEAEKWVKSDVIWQQLHKKGIHTNLYHLPTCSNKIRSEDSNFHGNLCIPYDRKHMNSRVLNTTLHTAFDDLKDDKVAFAVVYHDELDQLAHEHGPLSEEILNNALPNIDKIVQNLLHRIDESGSRVHLMIASDHGLAGVNENDRPIYFDFILSNIMDKVVNRGTTISIWASKEETEDMNRRLKIVANNFDVYDAKSLPNEWKVGDYEHFFPNIYLVAKPGFVFESKDYPIQLTNTGKSPDGRRGWHGYSPDHHEMHTPFMVYGPRAKAGVASKSGFDSVHIFNVLADILGVKHDLGMESPQPSNITSFLLHALETKLDSDSPVLANAFAVDPESMMHNTCAVEDREHLILFVAGAFMLGMSMAFLAMFFFRAFCCLFCYHHRGRRTPLNSVSATEEMKYNTFKGKQMSNEYLVHKVPLIYTDAVPYAKVNSGLDVTE